MSYKTLTIGPRKRVALIAHDYKKQDLLEWATFNRDVLAQPSNSDQDNDAEIDAPMRIQDLD